LRIKRQKQLKDIEILDKQEKKESDNTKVSVSRCSGRIQKFAKDKGLKGNDKESCSLMLLMDILDVGGTAIGVLKEGVFFNKTYKDLRKCLVENFNVREVISVPQDQFENTSTKTSIIIFDNIDEKTTEVKFSDLVVEKCTEDKFAEVFGDVVIIENKNDIVGVSDTLVSIATREEIVRNAICSLNGKDYGKKEIIVGEDYELVKLGSICKLENGNAFKTPEYTTFGIPMLSIKHLPTCCLDDSHYITENDKYKKFIINKNDILIALSGNTIGKFGIYLNDFVSYLNQRVAKITISDKVINRYLYYIFEAIDLQQHIIKISNNSAQPNVSSIEIEKLQIPIPKSPTKIQGWVDKIGTPYNDKKEKQSQIKELETFIQNRIIEIVEKEDCDKLNFDDVLQYVKKKNKYRANDGNIEGKYRFYTSSQDKVLYRDDYEFENNHILIGRGGVASLHLSSKFSVSHDDVYVLTARNLDYNLKFIYNYMKIHIKLIEDSFKGSTIKHSSKTALSKIEMCLPKNKQLIQDLEPVFQQIETLQNEVKFAEVLYKQRIQELGQEAIPRQTTVITEQPEMVNEIVEEVEIIVPKKKIIKK